MPDSGSLAAVRTRLERAGQSHLLAFYDGLAPQGRAALLRQIEGLDIEALPRLVETYVKNKPAFSLPADVQPAAYYPWDPAAAPRPYDAGKYRALGEKLVREGKLAAFVVAGGQGSRLGYEGPKGCYPGGAVSGKPLFQMFAEQLRAAEKRYGVVIPWYVMTSPLNHGATEAFFEKHGFFGLGRENVMFFMQGVLPSFDMKTGKVLLASKGEVATNPDGHGGSIRALRVSGALADMNRRGVEHVSYFQVDNPIVRVIDPLFIGLHAGAPDSSAEMSSKMIAKAYAEEKVGVFCRVGGRTEVIEYSDMPQALSGETLPDGRLRFLAGSIAIHVISTAFVAKLASDPAFALPYHRAEKKIPCVDPVTGEAVQPAVNNGVKLEQFVFDALSLCRSSIVYETDRVEEFAPIKNAEGVDSPESSRRIQTRRAARWLGEVGVVAPSDAKGEPDCTLEINPMTAMFPADLRGVKVPPIQRGEKRVI